MLCSTMFRTCSVFLLGLSLSLSVQANPSESSPAGPQSEKTLPVRDIVMHDKNGQSQVVGTLTLTALTSASSSSLTGYQADVSMDDSRFGDYFLSMRPFKCLESEQQLLCHLPYPYQNAQQITQDDLTDLEYQLLFIRKNPNDYGINPWFGVYYKLSWQNPPHGPITGQLHETDMDVLAAPPEDPTIKPITVDDLYEADSDVHWWPTITIQ